MNGRQFQFEWDEIKAAANLRKHGVPFELASTVFNDPRLLTVADLEHSETEERWFSIGLGSSGAMLSIVYLWSESDPAATKIRLISAREATQTEIRSYEESL
ncbi:MAG: BrnT family toxin [Acidobacteria bacterium]|nr:BrnT family toxin [Acidobacteriota bacterium]